MAENTQNSSQGAESQTALSRSLDQLEQMLNAPDKGREQAWMERVGWALSDVEQALGRHQATATAPDGPLDPEEIGTKRTPTLDRRAHKLCQDMNQFLDQVRELRVQVQEWAHPSYHTEGAPGLPSAEEHNRRAVRPQAEQLLAALRQLKDKEDGLILESVTTDIGVGD